MPNSDPTTAASWVRPTLATLLAAAAALLTTALVVGYHNIRYSYARIVDILARSSGAPAESIDLAAAIVPDWVAPFMQDLSVVSPALVAFTAARTAIAAGLLLRDPQRTRRWGAAHFPFPDPYKVYFIQMGLLGTIVGFVLAFAEVDPRAERQSLILLEALGTALWSTLTAILLSYVLCPVLEGLLQRAQREVTTPVPGTTRSALDLLRERTFAASESLDALRQSTQQAVDETAALSDELHARRLANRVAQLETDDERAIAALAQLDEQQRALAQRIDRLEATNSATDEQLQAFDATVTRHRGDIDRTLAAGERIPRLEAREDEQKKRADETAAELSAARSQIERLVATTARLEQEAEQTRRDRGRIDSLEHWLRGLQPFHTSGNSDSDG